ncbi:MAG: hypothetical protein HF981_11115 [Desulfobacteraceae bacterium]|nr:hypothetical protein [Desulfobacteraceae bacterium]MBC2750924.1 hypothetical protein [Desulfobacteraceae bacterium]
MPFQYQYHAATNCLHVIGRGRASLQDFLDYHRTVKIIDPKPDLRILADYRELDPSDLSTSDIEQIRESALRKIEDKFTSVKEATVVADTLAYGLTRMFDGVFHSEKYELNVFTDIREAEQWLGLTPEISRDSD